MSIKIETPPGLKGTTEQQLSQVYAFLFRLSESLNVALNTLTPENYSSASQIASSGASSSGQGAAILDDPKLTESYNELRALINNTATLVRSEMDEFKEEYSGKYIAVSDWGTYEEEILRQVSTTAEGVVESYDYSSILSPLNDQAAGFSQYKIDMEGYIRRGVFLDKEGKPDVGIAIGKNLVVNGVIDVDGEKYEQFDEAQNCAFYTANKVSFRVNGIEAAYVSNSKLFIHNVEITGVVIFNGKWELTTNGPFKIKWIGG